MELRARTAGELVAGANPADEQFRLLVESVTDYAIFLLDPTGRVVSWNPGAERIKGYTAPEILGQHFSLFYPPEDRAAGKADAALARAEREGRSQHVTGKGVRTLFPRRTRRREKGPDPFSAVVGIFPTGIVAAS